MRKVFRVLLLMAIVLSACESEQKRSNMATGMLALNLATSQDVIDATTTRAEAGDSGEENTEEDDLVPDVGDFTIALMDGNVVKTSWDKFSEFPKYAVVPVGTYTLKAYCGNPEKEGFESPYYEGTQEITVEDDETVEASITCYLTNVKLSVEYTDAFKKYFSDYSTVIQSDGGSSITFVKDEVRAAYVKPGVITIYADVVNQNGQTAKWEVGEIDEAKPREFYHIKLDVDAGSATLKISFDKTTVEKPVEIDVSDEALNIQPPFFTRSGYESGVVQDVKEGSTIFPLSTLVTARNGIKKCVLTTVSPSLLAQGWPTSVDLVNLAGETLEKLKSLGLSMRGLSTNVEKMATLDFAEVIPYLLSDDGEVSFSLVVTDKAGRVNAVDEVIKVNVQDNQFAVGTVEELLPVNATSFILPVTLNGDLSTVKYQYQKNDVWVDVVPSDIVTSEGINHQVTIELPFMIGKDLPMKVSCGNRIKELVVNVKPFSFSMEVSDSDCWATKAMIHLIYNDADELDYLKNNMTLQYFEVGADWVVARCKVNDDGVAEMTGLPERQEKENRIYQVKAECNNGATATVSLTTEVALQVPNAGFDEWYLKTDKVNKWFQNHYWYTFYRYNEGERESWGATINLSSTEWPRVGGLAYPVSHNSTSAVSYLSGSYAHGGKKCAEIRSMGSGNGYSNTADICYSGSCMSGRLFIGDYTWDGSSEIISYGRPFNSRPSSLEFYYQYIPYGTDEFEVRLEVLNRNGGKEVSLGNISYKESKSQTDWKYISIPVNYTNKELKATHFYISFVSSTKEQPEVGKNVSMILDGVNNNWKAHVGSRLRIDDVKLLY